MLEAAGADPGAVNRVTIGFDAVATLAAGKLDAATAFWNAEGVALQRLGVPIREFRVDDSARPRYPELVLATSRGDPARRPEARQRGQRRDRHAATRDRRPHGDEALDALLDAVPDLDPAEQRAQFDALEEADALRRRAACWTDGMLERAGRDGTAGTASCRSPLDVDAAFPLGRRRLNDVC